MIFGVSATVCQRLGMAAWTTNRAVMRRDTIIRKNSTSCALLMRRVRFIWFAPFCSNVGDFFAFCLPINNLYKKNIVFWIKMWPIYTLFGGSKA